MAHSWPGNVRELKNVIDRACAMAGRPGVPFSDLELDVAPPDHPGVSVRTDLRYRDAKDRLIEAFDLAYLKSVFDAADGNISRAARKAGLDRNYFKALLRKHGLLKP